MLPNTFIVGAAKSGTTALASLLSGAPDIYVSEIKEPHFHLPDVAKSKIPFAIKTKEAYASLYEGANAKVVVDASVLYLPMYESVIPSILDLHGDNVKIIIILREPLSRAISAYKHSLRFNANEDQSFCDAVKSDLIRRDGNPMLCYEWLSDYEKQVSAYLFSFNDVLIIESNFFNKNLDSVVMALEDFLGVSIPSKEPENNNKAGFEWRRPYVGRVINSLFPGALRWKLKNYFPAFYGLIKSTSLIFFGKKVETEVVIDPEIDVVFSSSREYFYELFKSKKVIHWKK